MVVMCRHAMVTYLAVLAAEWLLNMADCAVLVFNKKHNIIIIFLHLAIVVWQAIINLDDDVGDFLNTIV